MGQVLLNGQNKSLPGKFFNTAPLIIWMWLFAHDGLTGEAKNFAEEQGILWSSRREFDELLEYLLLHFLPCQ